MGSAVWALWDGCGGKLENCLAQTHLEMKPGSPRIL